MFKQNCYSDRIMFSIHLAGRTPKKNLSVDFLPSMAPIFNHIRRVLTRHNIETVSLPPRKVSSFLWPIKDDLGMKTARAYSIPVNVVRSALFKPGIPLRPESRSTTSASGCIILTNQLWPSTAYTWVTVSSILFHTYPALYQLLAASAWGVIGSVPYPSSEDCWICPVF
jgi:hypothetical protein